MKPAFPLAAALIAMAALARVPAEPPEGPLPVRRARFVAARGLPRVPDPPPRPDVPHDAAGAIARAQAKRSRKAQRRLAERAGA